MPIRRNARPAGGEDRPYVGFGWSGSVVRSAVPIDNQPTRFVKNLLCRIRDEYLTPAEVAAVIALQSPELQKLFPEESLLIWLKLKRYFQWPCAPAGSSALATLLARGRADFPWKDENAWNKHVAEAEQYRGERPHTSYVLLGNTEHDVLPGERFTDALRRVLRDQREYGILMPLLSDR